MSQQVRQADDWYSQAWSQMSDEEIDVLNDKYNVALQKPNK